MKIELKKTNKKFLLSFFLFMIICTSILFIIMDNVESKELKELEENYPLFSSNVEIKGIVLSNNRIYNYLTRGSVIKLNNGKGYRLTGTNINNIYKGDKRMLSFFIQLGDSINKARDSDTLYIYRNNKEYFFVLDKVIN